MKRLIFIILFAGILAWLGVYLITKPKLILNVSPAFGSHTYRPEVTSADTINFFNGSSFVSYSLLTQATKRLTPIYNLPNISVLKWGKNGVVFSSSGYTTNDDLYAGLNKWGLPTDRTYWWAIDFASGQIRLLSPWRINDAIWDESNNIYFAQEDGDQSVLYKISNGQLSSVAALPKVARLIRADDKQIIFTQIKSPRFVLSSLNLVTKKVSPLLELKTDELHLSPTGDKLFFVDPSDSAEELTSGKLAYYSFINKQSRTILSGFNGSIAWISNNTAVLTSLEKGGAIKLQGFDTGTEKLTKIGLRGKPKNSIQILTGGFNRLLMMDDQQRAYVAGESIPKLKSLASREDLQKKARQEEAVSKDFSLSWDAKRDRYVISIFSEPYRSTQQKALQYIVSLGADPNFMQITWQAGRLVSNDVPLSSYMNFDPANFVSGGQD